MGFRAPIPDCYPLFIYNQALPSFIDAGSTCLPSPTVARGFQPILGDQAPDLNSPCDATALDFILARYIARRTGCSTVFALTGCILDLSIASPSAVPASTVPHNAASHLPRDNPPCTGICFPDPRRVIENIIPKSTPT
jgi:hypothetical protein